MSIGRGGVRVFPQPTVRRVRSRGRYGEARVLSGERLKTRARQARTRSVIGQGARVGGVDGSAVSKGAGRLRFLVDYLGVAMRRDPTRLVSARGLQTPSLSSLRAERPSGLLSTLRSVAHFLHPDLATVGLSAAAAGLGYLLGDPGVLGIAVLIGSGLRLKGTLDARVWPEHLILAEHILDPDAREAIFQGAQRARGSIVSGKVSILGPTELISIVAGVLHLSESDVKARGLIWLAQVCEEAGLYYEAAIIYMYEARGAWERHDIRVEEQLTERVAEVLADVGEVPKSGQDFLLTMVEFHNAKVSDPNHEIALSERIGDANGADLNSLEAVVFYRLALFQLMDSDLLSTTESYQIELRIRGKIASTYLMQGRPQKALRYYNEAVAIVEARDDATPEDGVALAELRDYRDIVSSILAGNLSPEFGGQAPLHPSHRARVYEVLGLLYLSQSPQAAEPYLLAAMQGWIEQSETRQAANMAIQMVCLAVKAKAAPEHIRTYALVALRLYDSLHRDHPSTRAVRSLLSYQQGGDVDTRTLDDLLATLPDAAPELVIPQFLSADAEKPETSGHE